MTVYGVNRRTLGFTAAWLVALLLSGCVSRPAASFLDHETDSGELSDASDAADAPSDARSDTAVADAAPDLAPPCGGSCSADEICRDDTCVECTAEQACDVGVCEVESGSCVECLTSPADCRDPAAARCSDDLTCQGCLQDMDCRHLSDTPVCQSGTCVECSAANSEACGANVCNTRTSTCAANPMNSLTTCQACETDRECKDDRLCVVMTYKGAVRHDGLRGYCLPIFEGGACELPYVWNQLSLNRPSIDDPATNDFCGPNQMETTCEAILAFDDLCESEATCGAELDDSACAQVGGAASTRCTYACARDAECQGNQVCGTFCGVL